MDHGGHGGAGGRGLRLARRDDAGEQLGEDGLRRVLAGVPGSAEATVEAITAAVEEWLRTSRYEADDLAVLALTVPATS